MAETSVFLISFPDDMADADRAKVENWLSENHFDPSMFFSPYHGGITRRIDALKVMFLTRGERERYDVLSRREIESGPYVGALLSRCHNSVSG